MAIKKEKKLETQDLESLVELRKKNNDLIFQRGQLGLAEDNLQAQRDLLREEMQKLSQEEQTLSTQLFEKYGKGEVDIEKGTVTPVE